MRALATSTASAIVLFLLVFGLRVWGAAAPDGPRDRPLPAVVLPQPSDAIRIVAFGTSLTADYRWPVEVGRALSECFERPVLVEVVARPGAASDWGVTQTSAVLEMAPHIVLVEFAINDADLRDGNSRRVAARNTRSIVEALQDEEGSPAPAVALMTMSPATGVRGWLRPTLGRHYAQYVAMSDFLGTGLIDLYPRWLALSPTGRGLEEDGLHPDADTADEVIVPVVSAYLAESLEVLPCSGSEG